MVTTAIIRSISQLKHAVGIILIFVLVFAILGVGLFKGSLKHRCFYVTSPDSPRHMYESMSLKEFRAEWTTAFGDFATSAQSLKMLSPTLHRLNLSVNALLLDPDWDESRKSVHFSLLSTIETQAYVDNLWRLALPACDAPGLLDCDESYLPPLCQDPVDVTDRVSLGGYQCPPGANGSFTVCRASSPFFQVPNKNPPYFNGWCASSHSN